MTLNVAVVNLQRKHRVTIEEIFRGVIAVCGIRNCNSGNRVSRERMRPKGNSRQRGARRRVRSISEAP